MKAEVRYILENIEHEISKQHKVYQLTFQISVMT